MKKIKKSKSIVFKMFIITFVSVMSLITIIFLVQSLFINKYYITKKIDNIINNINSFSKQYKQEKWNYDELARQINKFEGNNNTTVTVNGLSYSDMQYEEYILTLQIDNSTYYDIYITKEDLLKAFDGEMPIQYQKFYLEAVIYDTEILTPYKINNYQMYDVLAEENYTLLKGDATIINISNVMDNITDIQVANNVDFINLIDIEDMTIQYTKKDDVYYLIDDMPFLNVKQVNYVKIIEMDNGKKTYINVTSSLQPVGEVMSILSDYYIIFYLLAIFISLAIAWIYSRSISNPLLKLTKVADKMAGMDFSVRSTLNSDDELGILSNSLNILSTNLDEALTDVKEANNQLVIDMEKEKQQEKVRREFVANISHELKTPLGIIKGFAEGIKDGIKKEKTDYYLEVILDEIEKMNTLILDMLELSKFETGKIEDKEEFDIIKLINKAVTLLEIPISDKKLKIDIKGDFTNVYGVKFQIDQVIMNLISNAVKYCTNNTTIIITGEIIDNTNYIYIYNEGNSLTKEELESIWLRFYKIDKSHNRESGGTGLGLAIVKAILDGHGSDYGVINKQNGVEFYFNITTNPTKTTTVMVNNVRFNTEEREYRGI
ncbi:sensor histidine kinase [Vallitalea sp.]|jgi:signal transduction histidine kinase|uniref:sensor histidine kinase n=1 Tax=Vallitalea sp. TaxID=1882829 RepID=UPI0025F94EF5|nr:HAMP domain-containing sensor histidine kinase [Vallitalea sp.]MCT4688796.1 HAMP domain-containing histidine kinase [Vallitalea sp.]